MKQLSVIIPMYNVAQYLEKCIDSVYNQGLDEREFEVILVDDESPDNSLAVATSLTKNKSNVTIISQKNKGLGGARNTGIENAEGKYLLFLDSDDWYLPNTLVALIEKAEQYDLDILEFGAEGITLSGNKVYTKSLDSGEIILDGIEYCKKFRYMDSACNKLYNRDFLHRNCLFFVERLYIEDYEFNTRVFFNAKKVKAIATILAQFLQSPNSITRNIDSSKKDKMKEDIIKVIKRVNTFYLQESDKNNIQESSYFKQRLGYLVATLFFQLLKSNSSYRDFLTLKERLIKEDIFFVEHPVSDFKKEWFRRIFLKNFVLFRLIVPAFKLI